MRLGLRVLDEMAETVMVPNAVTCTAILVGICVLRGCLTSSRRESIINLDFYVIIISNIDVTMPSLILTKLLSTTKLLWTSAVVKLLCTRVDIENIFQTHNNGSKFVKLEGNIKIETILLISLL